MLELPLVGGGRQRDGVVVHHLEQVLEIGHVDVLESRCVSRVCKVPEMLEKGVFLDVETNCETAAH